MSSEGCGSSRQWVPPQFEPVPPPDEDSVQGPRLHVVLGVQEASEILLDRKAGSDVRLNNELPTPISGVFRLPRTPTAWTTGMVDPAILAGHFPPDFNQGARSRTHVGLVKP
jgi:hypothetical protein